MKKNKPVPLFPTYDALCVFEFSDYSQLDVFLGKNENQTWRKQHWLWAKEFLIYIGRNKSPHTYTRFRNDIERFLLWLFIERNKEMTACRKKDILLYADFCWSPPNMWINTANVDKFLLLNGDYVFNPKWSPFRYSSIGKNTINHASQNSLHYQPSQQTLNAMFTAVNAFYNYLVGEEICFVNPISTAKKDCRHFIYDAQVKDVKRLTSDQWDYVYETALSLADTHSKFERSLFVVCALKTLFLRISELSERENWTPVMSHFWEDSSHNYWLKVYGKGRKVRDITVPNQFITYLKRYRQHRGLPPLPHSQETTPIVEKIRGKGGMTARHLRRLVQEVFDVAYDRMQQCEGEDKARKLKEASTHWLRHTGASMEIERGRALKDLSEDLGHASMATTDTIYVQTENTKRAKSGKNRTVIGN